MPKAEQPLKNGEILFGVEIEGLGTVKIEWNAAATALITKMITINKNSPQEDIQQKADFQNYLKPIPLIRSKSFVDSEGQRGIFIAPEIQSSHNLVGMEHPAELVSAPHPLTSDGLSLLHQSVRKVLTAELGKRGVIAKKPKLLNITHAQELADDITHKTQISLPEFKNHNDSSKNIASTPAVAISEFTKNMKSAGGIQTTIGVSVSKLLNSGNGADVPDPILLLTAQGDKAERVRELIKATNQIASAILHKSNLSPSQAEGYKLSVLLHLAPLISKEAKGPNEMEKDVLGINFKGCTSYEACIPGFKPESIYKPTDDEAVEIKKTFSKYTPHFKEVLNKLNFSNIGAADQSIQVTIENGNPIENFLHNNELFTVIESREGNSMINSKMKNFLFHKDNSHKDSILHDIKTHLTIPLNGEASANSNPINDGSASSSGPADNAAP